MSPLFPPGDRVTSSTPSTVPMPEDRDWGAAIGNLEDTKLALDALAGLIYDAVFLDDEAYTSACAATNYQQRLLAQLKKSRQLQHELAALQAELQNKDAALATEKEKCKDAQRANADLQQQLDNNAVVFQMHYQELLTRNEEIGRLKAVIEGLQAELHGTADEARHGTS